jgi:hypothetical protein
MSANPGVQFPSGHPGTIDDVEAEIARLGEDNYAMKLEVEKMSERLTQDAMMLEMEKVSEMPAQRQESSDLPLVMGIFSVGATVGALLYTIATKLLSSSRDATSGLLGGAQGQELQLAGAAAGAHAINCNCGSCSYARSGTPMMSATIEPSSEPSIQAPRPPPLPPIKTMRVGDNTLAGDMGFDPLQIANMPEKLAWQCEAEVKPAVVRFRGSARFKSYRRIRVNRSRERNLCS